VFVSPEILLVVSFDEGARVIPLPSVGGRRCEKTVKQPRSQSHTMGTRLFMNIPHSHNHSGAQVKWRKGRHSEALRLCAQKYFAGDCQLKSHLQPVLYLCVPEDRKDGLHCFTLAQAQIAVFHIETLDQARTAVFHSETSDLARTALLHAEPLDQGRIVLFLNC